MLPGCDCMRDIADEQFGRAPIAILTSRIPGQPLKIADYSVVPSDLIATCSVAYFTAFSRHSITFPRTT
jgi:hypothetical protein